MKKNLGPLDRLIRMLIANTLVLLVLFRVIRGDAAAAAVIAAFLALGTSLLSFCPLYALLGISTLKRE